jgi:hypothetical protein
MTCHVAQQLVEISQCMACRLAQGFSGSTGSIVDALRQRVRIWIASEAQAGSRYLCDECLVGEVTPGYLRHFRHIGPAG